MPHRFICCEIDYPAKAHERKSYFMQHEHTSYLQMPNLGHMANIAQMTERISGTHNDQILFWDWDHNITPNGWLTRMIDFMQREDSCYYLTTRLKGQQSYYTNQGTEEILHGEKVRQLQWAGGWPIGLHRATFTGIKKLRDYYGGGEASILKGLDALGVKGYMMADLEDQRHTEHQDPLYPVWKAKMTVKPIGQQITFSEFVALIEKNGYQL